MRQPSTTFTKQLFTVFALLLLSTPFTLLAQMDEKFYFPDKEWKPIDSLSYRNIIFHTDNDTIHSVIIEPETKAKATILYFHGNGSNISKWIEHVRPLVKDGFRMCMLDYRGYGKSTGKPTHLNIARDAQNLLDTLLTYKEIRSVPLIIYGASIGSQVATHLTKSNNENISALVLDGMMTSFTDVALLSSPPEQHHLIRQYVTSPYSAKEDIKSISGIKVLFIHSKEDPIPIEGAQSIYDSCNCEKDFWLYEGKHIEAPLRYPELFVQYMNRLLN